MLKVLLVREGEHQLLVCSACQARAPLEESLPFVKQAAAFLRGHDCPQQDASTWTDFDAPA